ncbi:Protein fam13a [Dermatophagoides farinae]|uniref:Protein fam13a n=1 Tax=Dermatophagoides farinae TaxID=6954 RepID=A0A922L3L4_DERFA|nr:Protein fam13a [Dermatophagoides farinae]
MKARIRRISASVDTALSPTSDTLNINTTTAIGTHTDSNLTPDISSNTSSYGYNNNNPTSKSLDICVPESRIERMRKLLSSPLLKRKTASSSQHHHHHHHHHVCSSHQHTPTTNTTSTTSNNRQQLPQPSSSASSSPSSSPALGQNVSMKTFGVSLESLSHHQHPHHQQQQNPQQQHSNHHCMEEYYVRDPEQIIVPHQKAAHILGQACPGCLTSAPSNSSSTGSINDTSSGHFSPHGNPDDLHSSLSSIAAASPSSGNSSSSTTSSTASSTGGVGGGGIGNIPCLIPFIVTRLCTYIENSGGLLQEGLFRISGNAKIVDKLKQSFDNNGDAPLETDGDLAAAAALLKQFLRELPQPLIPNGSQFLDVIRSLKNDHETCVLSLKALVSQLPDENYYTLRYLIRFLHRIAQRNEENRMTSTNLGIVFAPNIFRVCVDTYQGLKDQSSANEVVNLLISDYSEIFNESSDVGCHSVEGAGSSGDLSYGSESQCPCTQCPDSTDQQQKEDYEEEQQQQLEITSQSSINLDVPYGDPNIQEIRSQLDKKRKSYQSQSHHHTIDDRFHDDRSSQSFDYENNHDNNNNNQSINSGDYYLHRHPPQRCNSEEMYGKNVDQSIVNRLGLKIDDSYRKSSHSHDIIITNSSDSVSTDDNTTTATSTGPTVRSVIIGVGQVDICNHSGGDMTDISEDNFAGGIIAGPTIPNYSKLLTVGDAGDGAKGARSISCGSDCTENVNIPTSLSFASDDDEDSLLKSIASECSDGNDDEENTSSSSSNDDNNNDNADGTDEPQQSDSKQPVSEETEQELNVEEQKPFVEDPKPEDLTEIQPENESKLSKDEQENRTSKSRHRRLQSIRKKLKQFEIDFEQENGYQATFENKMSSSFARPLMVELNTLLQAENSQDNPKPIESIEKKTIDSGDSRNPGIQPSAWKSPTATSSTSNSYVFTTEDIFNTIFGSRKEKSLARISEMMTDIQRTLNEKRIIAQRPESLDLMTGEQILDEKLALQKALLRFEALCGRPSSKAERDIVRPVYDRYRLVKRHASKLNQKQTPKLDPNTDLQPILEHVQMNFTSPTHQKTNIPHWNRNRLKVSDSDQSSATATTCDMTNNSSTSSSKEKNYHIMSQYELMAHLNEYRQQKRNLRSVLRTFENDFYKKTGRHVEKEDRSNMSSVYASYKTIKGKIKLIEALISKKCPNSEKKQL